MILQLKELFDREGARQAFQCELDLSGLRHGGGYPLQKPVQISGTVENRTGIVTLGYLAMFTLNTLCDRCLTPVERDFSMRFEHILVRELAGKDEEEFIVCADDTLDLIPLATEDILLELPTRILCREDCKGLCPKCGTNLNESTCDCNQDAEVDSRLSVLLTLLDQDDEN